MPVWCPYLKGDINKLEKIQHRVTRLIPSLKRLPYNERLKRMGLTTLEARRKRGDLIQVFKIFNNIEKVDLVNCPKFKWDITTRGHNQKYSREICTTEARQNILKNRIFFIFFAQFY